MSKRREFRGREFLGGRPRKDRFDQRFLNPQAPVFSAKMNKKPDDSVKIETYKGNQEDARSRYAGELPGWQEKGYLPIATEYIPGTRPGSEWFATIIFCFLWGIGIPFLIYKMLVKPPGRLVVTYKIDHALLNKGVESICPMCAETIKKNALLCKHCGHDLASHNATLKRAEDAEIIVSGITPGIDPSIKRLLKGKFSKTRLPSTPIIEVYRFLSTNEYYRDKSAEIVFAEILDLSRELLERAPEKPEKNKVLYEAICHELVKNREGIYFVVSGDQIIFYRLKSENVKETLI